jgi:DNA-directed RNA polymerase
MENTITTEMMIKEILWENHAIDEGVAKYNALKESKTMEATTGGQKLLKQAIPQLIEGIKEAWSDVEKALYSPTSGGKDNWVYMIGLVSAEQAAVITLNKAIQSCSNQDQGREGIVRPLTKEIGKQIRQQVKFENWKETEKELLKEHNFSCGEGETRRKSKAQYLIEQAKGQITRPKLARWEKKFESYKNIEWGEDEYNIGAKLLDILVTYCPEFFEYKTIKTRNKQERKFIMTDEAWNTYVISEETAELQRPFLLPTLIKPRDWKYVEGKVEGGYYHIDKGLFSDSRLTAHTSADNSAASVRFLESVSILQNTAWAVNPFTLLVIKTLADMKLAVGGVTQNDETTTPYMDQADYEAMDKEEAKKYQKKRTAIVKAMASHRGKHSAFLRKLAIAEKMSVHEEFFFPHFADFRGRLYPMCSELTPQGDQIAKGLLQFANGKKLGESGLKWLMIHAANCYGMDKASLTDREQWGWDNLELMASVSSNYITDQRWVIINDQGKVDNEALPFLAAAREITEAMKLSNPSDFVSHIAVAQDGTCNGMQILSMLGKDQIGAKATNCTSLDERQDLYMTVATAVRAIIARDQDENPMAKEWAARFGKGRGIVKRACMTVPYGVTPKGIATQLENDDHCVGMSNSKEAAQYMTKAILESMGSVNGKAVEIMHYFQTMTLALAEVGLGLSWYTPMGLKVTQQYNNLAEKRVKTVLGDIRLMVEDAEMGLRVTKQANSSAPNIIHSLDAAMLQMTLERLKQAGHDSFAMIHDSYGMHPSNVEELHVALRAVAFEMFSGNPLQDLHDYVQSNTDVELPTPPTLGDYDINEITNALYFFS